MATNGTTDDRQWISAKEAVNIMTASGAIDPVSAKASLTDLLRDGRLTAKAKSVWIDTSSNPATLSWKVPEDNGTLELDLITPVTFWRSDKRELEDRSRWRWAVNNFFYTTNLKPLKRRMMRGVQLDLHELSMTHPRFFVSPNISRKGRPPEVEKRDGVWLEILEIALASELHSNVYRTRKDLLDDLLKRKGSAANGQRLAGEVQIKDVAKQAWERMKFFEDRKG
jgi:hypothetical protein